MSRRGENIHKRKDGRWEARYEKGRTEKGTIIYGFLYGKSYREAKAQNLPELEQRKDHLQSVYLQMQSRNMREFVEAMEQTVPDRLLAANPDTFFDVMADVIMTNKKAAANRLGIFYAMKVMFR